MSFIGLITLCYPLLLGGKLISMVVTFNCICRACFLLNNLRDFYRHVQMDKGCLLLVDKVIYPKFYKH